MKITSGQKETILAMGSSKCKHILCGWRTFRTFGRICNPTASNIRNSNPVFGACFALQMLIFTATGLQIRPNVIANPAERHGHHERQIRRYDLFLMLKCS